MQKKMSYNIKQVLISRDGLTSQEADKEIKQLRQRVWDGERLNYMLQFYLKNYANN
jgi:hypothetical protein